MPRTTDITELDVQRQNIDMVAIKQTKIVSIAIKQTKIISFGIFLQLQNGRLQTELKKLFLL